MDLDLCGILGFYDITLIQVFILFSFFAWLLWTPYFSVWRSSQTHKYSQLLFLVDKEYFFNAKKRSTQVSHPTKSSRLTPRTQPTGSIK